MRNGRGCGEQSRPQAAVLTSKLSRELQSWVSEGSRATGLVTRNASCMPGCGQNIRMWGARELKEDSAGYSNRLPQPYPAVLKTAPGPGVYYTGVLPLSCVPSLPPTSLFLRQSLSKCPSESLTCNPPVSVLAEEGIESWALCVLGKHAITELHLQPFAAFFFLILEKATCGTYLPYSFWCPFFFSFHAGNWNRRFVKFYSPSPLVLYW